VTRFAPFAEPFSGNELFGETHAAEEFEWKMPFSAVEEPESSPENAGSLAAPTAEELSCQFPVALTALPGSEVLCRLEQPTSIRLIGRKRHVLTEAQDRTKRRKNISLDSDYFDFQDVDIVSSIRCLSPLSAVCVST
jgi:hypothetical protein